MSIHSPKKFENLFILPNFHPLYVGFLFWSFLRLLNNKLYPNYRRKQIEFNLPTHFATRPIILQYAQIFVDFYILFLSSPLRRFPRAQSERIFIATVCLLSLNIVSLFQSSLATVFITPMYYKNIESLEQLVQSNYKILIKYPAMMTDIFPEDSSDTYRVLHSRLFLKTDTKVTSADAIKMGFATVTRKISLKLTKADNFVHLVSECPRSYNIAFLLSLNSVYSERINSLILDIGRFGLINKWINDVNFKVMLERFKEHPPPSNRPKVLTLDDLLLSFLILLSGAFISTIIFVIEKVLQLKTSA